MMHHFRILPINSSTFPSFCSYLFRSHLLNIIVLSVFLITPLFVKANDINSLYEASIAYDTMDASINQETMIRQAFVKVILKLTGDTQFEALKDRNLLIREADKLVLKFSSASYVPQISINLNEINNDIKGFSELKQSHNVTEQLPITEDDISKNRFKKLKVTFNPIATNQILKKYNLYPWLSIRPDTLLWLSVDVNNKRSILSPVITPKIFDLLRQQAKESGLGIKFPYADLQDIQRLSINDLWDDFSDTILSASQRYHTPSILTSRVHLGSQNQWYANWSLYIVNKEIKWQSQSDKLESLLRNGITDLLFRLSKHFKIKDSDRIDNQISIKVNNVTSYIDFQRLESYLKKVSVINNFKLKFVTGDSLLFQINFVGSKEHLLQNLAWGDVLQQLDKLSNADDDVQGENEQHFKAVDLIDIHEPTSPTTASKKPESQPFSYKASDQRKNAAKTDDGESDVIKENEKQVLNLLDTKQEAKVFLEQKTDVEFWLRD
ncbi:MAG: DUF2066 domain-containing protein [Gammaproteobacteria bacterium]|nr:DUF2066 domain-containing protein [Gammaproteobacteria bacterium]